MEYIDITPNVEGLRRWALEILKWEPDSEVARMVLTECGGEATA